MRSKLLIFVLALPAFLLAGAWTGMGVSHRAALQQAAVITFPRQATVLFFSVLDSISRITEGSLFFVLGACCITLAWALHRRSFKSR